MTLEKRPAQYSGNLPPRPTAASSGAWTDLIWAGSNLLAEVAGSQTAAPVYRLLDHEGSLVATTDGSGNVTGTNLMMPYGETLSSNTSDPYAFAGLYQDTEYGGDDAWYRNYSTEQSRWLTPDPYNGSYDINNPQSFNRYMYTNGNPLAYTDPSGLALGILNSAGGSICKAFGGMVDIGFGNILQFNPCSPIGSAAAIGIDLYIASFTAGSAGSYLSALTALKSANVLSSIAVGVGTAITIACSIDSDPTLCGPSGWTSAAFTGKNQWVGKGVNDLFALAGAIACVSGPEGCLGYAIYSVANDLFSVFWDLFGPPQFTGSLLPRPTALGGLGTAPIGIPNQNLTVKELLSDQSTKTLPTPGQQIQ